jgi:hypothetical protein
MLWHCAGVAVAKAVTSAAMSVLVRTKRALHPLRTGAVCGFSTRPCRHDHVRLHQVSEGELDWSQRTEELWPELTSRDDASADKHSSNSNSQWVSPAYSCMHLRVCGWTHGQWPVALHELIS